MADTTMFKEVPVTESRAVLKEKPTQFLWTAPYDEQIHQAETIISQLEATIATQLAEQRRRIDLLVQEKARIQSACPHTVARLHQAAVLTTTLLPGVMFGSSAEGVCLDCGKRVNCCPHCGSAQIYSYRVGSWDNEFDYQSSALAEFRKLGGGFNFFDSGKPFELHRGVCENPSCHKSWSWLEDGPDPMDNW